MIIILFEDGIQVDMMEKKTKTVAVMMSSYNGELFIEEQINSVLRQSDVDVHLYIRDDGSTDKTIRILQEYSDMDNVTVEYGRNVGVGNSFMDLLWSIPDTYDYYSFCDQDDVWETDKLIAAVTRLSTESGCALYASSLECVDINNNSIGIKFEPGREFDSTLLSAICRNQCFGCTQVFNKELFLLLYSRRPAKQLLQTKFHDAWVSVSAAAAGRILYDRESHIRYRRHGRNYNNSMNPGRVEKWKRRFSKLIHPKKGIPGVKWQGKS